MKRFFLSLLLLGSIAGAAAADAPLDVSQKARPPFAIPAKYGDITDYQPAKPGKDQLVIMIQDLHANVGVQKNIAAILYRLNRLDKARGLVVCVEGASGEGDVSLLRSLPGPVRYEFESMLLRKAYLTGAELAATESHADWAQQQAVVWNRIKAFFGLSSPIPPVSLSPIELWGVDDPDLYRKNWHAAKTVDRLQNPALASLRDTKSMLTEGANSTLKTHLDLLTKMLMLRLQPKEYKDYLPTRKLNPRGPAEYEQALSAAEDYYKYADLRSTAMTQNLLKKIGARPLAVLVTGGFHTQEMAAQLKTLGIGYAVVTPQVEVLDQDAAYKARLREEE